MTMDDSTPTTTEAASEASAPETNAPDKNAPEPGELAQPRATGSAIPADELERLTRDIVDALKTVYDPEIPVDIYELGLIYRVDIDDDRNVTVDMTLTAPGCPVAGEMPIWVENVVSMVAGVSGAQVNMVFDPPWGPDRMSDVAKVALDWY